MRKVDDADSCQQVIKTMYIPVNPVNRFIPSSVVPFVTQPSLFHCFQQVQNNVNATKNVVTINTNNKPIQDERPPLIVVRKNDVGIRQPMNHSVPSIPSKIRQPSINPLPIKPIGIRTKRQKEPQKKVIIIASGKRSQEEGGNKVEILINNNGKFNCNYCRKSFHLELNYNRHLSSHTGEKLVEPDKVVENVPKIFINKITPPTVPEENLEDKTISEKLVEPEEIAENVPKILINKITPPTVSQENLGTLQKMISELTSFKCPIYRCGKYFKSEEDLFEHAASIHDIQMNKDHTFSCTTCGKCFSTVKSIYKHIKGVHYEKKHPCEICHQYFKKSYIQYHMQSHHKTKTTQPQQTQSQAQINQHQPQLQQKQAKQKKQKQVFCETCGKTFAKPFYLKMHSLAVHGNWVDRETKTFECGICKKRFSHENNLKTHRTLHNGIKPFKCEQCGKRYSQKCTLKAHIDAAHDVIERFECKECGQRFQQRWRLTSHLDSHEINKPYKCTICEKSFTKEAGLQLHVSHHSEKMFKCDVCGKCLMSRHHFDKHIQKHNVSYKCDKCDKIYSTKGKLNAHIIVHSDNFPHKCETCGDTFKRKCGLKAHMERHRKGKPFKCEKCNKSFRSISSVKRHDNDVHKKLKPHKCEVCGNCFAQGSQPKYHLSTHKDLEE